MDGHGQFLLLNIGEKAMRRPELAAQQRVLYSLRIEFAATMAGGAAGKVLREALTSGLSPAATGEGSEVRACFDTDTEHAVCVVNPRREFALAG